MVHNIAQHRPSSHYAQEAKAEIYFSSMVMDDNDEEDDYEDLSSSGEDEGVAQVEQNKPSPPPHPNTQPMFLNFTSDLSPQGSGKKKSKQKRQTTYRVNGVNILNRNNLDSKTAIERLQRRRENHNHVERRRRDNINNTILELSNIVPGALHTGQKLNKGNILRLTLDYIKNLQSENQCLKSQTKQYPPSAPNSPTNVGPSYAVATQSHSVPNSPMSRSAFEDGSTSVVPPLVLSSQYHSLHHHHHHHGHHRQPPSTTPPIVGMPSVLSSTGPMPGTSAPLSQSGGYHIPSPPLYPSSFISTNTRSLPQIQQHQPCTYHKPPASTDQPIPAPSRTPSPLSSTSNSTHTPGSLRALLPASKSHSTGSSGFLPPLRMSGYEKIYGGACRY